MRSLKLIACTDRHMGIGRHGGLLFDLPDDRRRFRDLTSGHVVVMGRKTWESLPKRPLEGRTNIIISRGWLFRTLYRSFIEDGAATIVDSPDEAVELARQHAEDHQIWVIGGGEIYRQMLPMCDEAYITHVDADGHADTFFEGWNPNEWDEGETLLEGGGGDAPTWKQVRYRRLWD